MIPTNFDTIFLCTNYSYVEILNFEVACQVAKILFEIAIKFQQPC